MIAWVVKGLIAVVLFAGSLVGGLAATGRLNHEGTANIPLLNKLFPAPEAAPGDGDFVDPHAAPAGETSAGGGEPVDPLAEAPRRQKTGRSLQAGEGKSDAAAAHGGEQPDAANAHGETAAPSNTNEHAAPVPASAGKSGSRSSPEADFARLEHALADDKSPYRPGEYFRFDGMPSGLTADQINEAWQRVQGLLAELEKKRTALELREQELQELADDVSRRQAALGTLRVDVEQMQRQLDARIVHFQEQVKLVRNDEVAALKRNATTLASFEPSKAAELVQEQWKTEKGQDEVLKLFEFMDKDAVNSLLQVLPTAITQDVLKKRLHVTKEPAPSGRGG